MMEKTKWVKGTLRDFGEIVSGGTPKTKIPEYWGEDVSWITPADLSGYSEKYIHKGRKSITHLGLEKSSAKLMPKGSVLFSSRAPIGYVAIAGNELSTNQGFKSLVPNSALNNDFLYYYFKSLKPLAEKRASGTTFKELSGKAFADLPLSLPPLPEQRAIVSKIEQLFSELDNGISNLKLAQKQLKVYRQAVLKKAFEGELTKEWREQQVDLPGADELLVEIKREREKAEKVSRRKKPIYKPLSDEELEKLPKLPESWLWVKLDTFGELFCGQSPSTKDVNLDGKGTLYVTGPEQWDGKKIKETKWTEYPKRIVPDGCIFITVKGAGVGKLFPGVSCAIGRDIYAFLPSSKVDFKYTVHALMREIDMIIMKAQGDIPGLSKNHILGHHIGLCSLQEQQAIVNEIETRLSVCDKLEQDIAENLEKAEVLRQSILKKAFEGKLLSERELEEVRNAPDWEPAEVLLEKVKAEKKGKK